MRETAIKWVHQLLAQDNSLVSLPNLLALIGFLTGWTAFVLYAFFLRRDPGDNLAEMAMAMMGVSGGGLIAGLFQKHGGSLGEGEKK
jgi:hypothetical protein